ncbi:T9SS C-terminal target domain-containing protein [Spirosoma sp. HMF3257]|uniref:T9SS C-terminal target domain-containing protein n=1 Tax=Spirosoma telluris TaxID=2183553 RepID=A0A327ND97_9BACT|nr:T9SS C-terminal target domain-containing protein [Spirosoma telluris]RAI73241.1 T9SS C-terminal target domain-containing protein [Spirosoma telluris]
MKIQILSISFMLTAHVLLAQDYPQQLSIGKTITAGAVSDQKAVATIVANNEVNIGAKAHYTAGLSVTMLPGFVAQAGSVFRATIAPVSSGRSATDAPGLQVRAYPNPFTDQTTIDYNLPTDGRVRHTLLNAKGQILQQVDNIDGELAGLHQTQVGGLTYRWERTCIRFRWAIKAAHLSY